jgi:glycosyltransferase involved in cell wall biosynthesis
VGNVQMIERQTQLMHPKKRYLMLSPWPVTPGSGVNGVILGLAEAMKDSYEPVIVVTGWTPPSSGQLWLKMPLFSLPVRNAIGFFVLFLPNMLRLQSLARGAVAVNPHFVGLELLPLLALRALRLCPRVILSVHGADINEAARASGLKAVLYRCMFRAADVVVACSNALAREVRQISPKANVVSVWNAVRWPEGVSRQRPMESRYVVCVAGFVRKKAHDILLPAFQRILCRYTDLRLVLIGNDGPERAAVSALVRALHLSDSVLMMHDVEHQEVLRWILHAECLVLPSRDEPFGIALLEAGALGTPVVATRVGGVPEFVTDGVCGILCDSDNPDQIARAVSYLLENREQAMSLSRAFKLRVRELTWSRSFAEYQEKAICPNQPT